MAKNRPSVQKRQREFLKRQREQRKAEKAAEKRKRRENRDESGVEVPVGDEDVSPAPDETPEAVE